MRDTKGHFGVFFFFYYYYLTLTLWNLQVFLILEFRFGNVIRAMLLSDYSKHEINLIACVARHHFFIYFFLQPHFSTFLNYLFENEGSVFWNNYTHPQYTHTCIDWKIITSEICIILNFMQSRSKYASFPKLITVLIFL